MRNLNKADIVPEDLLNSVILSKRGSNKTRMEAMRNDLEERYDEYCDKVDNNTLHLLSEKWHYDKDAIMRFWRKITSIMAGKLKAL